ncbi:MAG: tail fiber protein [Reinekea sp.]
MADPFLGEIRMFAGVYAPVGWSNCEGQSLAINQNGALYSLLGTYFGGNGTTNFNLPDYRGRVPVGTGNYCGEFYYTGHTGGLETVTLTTETMPPHSHSFRAQIDEGNTLFPIENSFCARSAPSPLYSGAEPPFYGDPSNLKELGLGSVTNSGGGQSHVNTQPSLVMRFAIAMQGEYPSRN